MSLDRKHNKKKITKLNHNQIRCRRMKPRKISITQKNVIKRKMLKIKIK
jgi:hypothetical protein